MSDIRPPDGLRWARPVEKPDFIPVSRPRGSKAAGLRYERSFAKFMAPLGVIHGQWFEFEDASGLRYCQTDLLFPLSLRLMAIIEVKYTFTTHAYDQLLDLYKPVVEAAYNIPVGLVVVYKNLRDTNGFGHWLHDDIPTAARWSRESGEVGLVHWVGQPVVPKSNQRTVNVLKHIHNQRTV